MNGNTALFWVTALRLMVVAAAIAAAYRLAKDSKEGWGWMTFVAVVAAQGSLKFD